jgi:hypothetical protein
MIEKHEKEHAIGRTSVMMLASKVGLVKKKMFSPRI